MRRLAALLLLACLVACGSDNGAPLAGRYTLQTVDGAPLPQPFLPGPLVPDSLVGGTIDFGAHTITLTIHRTTSTGTTTTATPTTFSVKGDSLCWSGPTCRGYTRKGDRVTLMNVLPLASGAVPFVFERD